MKIIQIDETEFSKSTKISIDYAIMEKAENTVVVPADIDWNDIGSWNSLSALFSQDGQNNAYKGDVVFEQSKNNIVYSESCLVTLLGLNDCVVASTRDAILVAKRDQVQNVKQLVNHLKDNNRREVAEHCKVFALGVRMRVLMPLKVFRLSGLLLTPDRNCLYSCIIIVPSTGLLSKARHISHV